MSEFKFSIIIPTHNSAEGIGKTLNSLINQTLDFEKNIEAIIVDNNSIDNTKRICEKFTCEYPKNIRFFENDCQIAKNIGLEKANGKYVGFLENNDYLSENSLKDVLKFFNDSPDVDVTTVPIYYYKNNRKERYLDYAVKKTSTANLLKEPEKAQLLGPSTFIRKDAIKTFFLNDFNEYISFLNDILINNPNLGICKEASYYMKYIEEKMLPTEDRYLDFDEYDDFVENNLNNIVSKSKEKFLKMPKFIQYELLNQINWIFSMEQSKYELDLSKFKKIVELIDDEIIFDNLLLEEEMKPALFMTKYDNNLNEDIMDKLKLNTVFIDVYDIINNKLNILAHIKNNYERDVKVYVNGNSIPIKKVRFPQNDNYSLGHRYLYDYSFEAKIPLSTTKKYEIEFKSKNKKLNIDFSRPCNFSKIIGYAKTKHYLSVHKDDKIVIKKKNGLSWILQEAKTTFRLLKNRDTEFLKAFPFRLAYMLGYPFLKNRRIWFYMDRPDESDDNGLHLFKYAIKKDDGITRYFILSKDNDDYEEIKKIGKVIPYKSIRHRFLGLFVENIITSHPDNGIIYPFWGGYPYFAGLLKSNNIFLQHGILKDNISTWLNKSSMNLSFFLVSSTKEFSSIFNHPYNYGENVVQLKGLPRYDNLKNIKNKKQIIIMPSWRRNLTTKSNEYIQETEYFKRFNSLINNERLIQKAKEYGYEIIFRPHPNVYNFINLYDENDYVKIDYDKTKFQVLFNNGSLMITDFSSVAFDFAYLNKPVIYYQYAHDYHFNVEDSFFDYETMGFGEICKREDELVNLIIEYMENDCKIKDMYRKRIDDFFIFKDRNNCKRVHEAIEKIPLKD